MGVVGCTLGDNNPLLAFISAIAPAIVRGNAIVCVPSEKYPLAATDLYQVLDTSDLPGGVVYVRVRSERNETKVLRADSRP